jgi:hypothetical protein
MSIGNASVRPASSQRSLARPLSADLLLRHGLRLLMVRLSPWVLSEERVGLLSYELSGATLGLMNAVAILLLISCCYDKLLLR